MLFHITPFYRKVAGLLLVTLSAELFFPPVALALTGGPGQPEFSNFEPVSSANLVNEFTGDFTYNLPVIHIPGPNGSGYPLSLSYHSGASPEEEASWVGNGWTLNPGAITRATRGLPDDFKGAVDYWNKAPRNWTASVGMNAGLEAFSFDKITGSANTQLRYNNFSGFGYSAGIGLHSLGISLGLNVSDGKRSYSADVNPFAMYAGLDGLLKGSWSQPRGEREKGPPVRYALNPSFSIGGGNGIFTHAESVRPNQVSESTGESFTVSFGTEFNPGLVPIGGTMNTFGSYSYQKSVNGGHNPKMSYGFMYTGDRISGTNHITDYYVEKENPFQKRDLNLGVPFNNADNFVVTGEGIGGGFRMYHRETGTFSPNALTNYTSIATIGPELSVGLNFGPGSDVGVGAQSLAVSDWGTSAKSFSKPDDEQVDEPVFFRFNNDLGGSWTETSDAPIQVAFNRQGAVYMPEDASGKLKSQTERSGRSAYIGFNTNKNIKSSAVGITSHRAYTKRSDVENLAERTAESAIGEFAITTDNGQRYHYGLPLNNRNESSLLYGVMGAATEQNYLVYSDREAFKTGQELKDLPYANTFLLTEIVTPDYIDKTLNGPSSDDLGGYTVFGYDKRYGGAGSKSQSWYRWRTPYQGMLYQRNSLSDPMDDMGSVSEGEKEIAYLQYIKTKTHIAVFKTLERKDALEAVADARNKENLTPAEKQGRKKLRHLDRIDLYLLTDLTSTSGEVTFDAEGNPNIRSGVNPIKTVRFKYNYSSWSNLPNSEEGVGKLTLERVWFEYNGQVKSKISPYEFSYAYPAYTTYPAQYRDTLSVGYTGLDELPQYNAFAIDAWGNYQSDTSGARRYSELKSWLNQKQDLTTFDPAAWQLKVIRLPSGGEIHVQYEQDDYTYVQDKAAHVMLNLTKADKNTQGEYHRFYVDISDLGVSAAAVRQLLQQYYVDNPEGKQKIYFKMLYTLIGAAVPSIGNCNADYITGYADIHSIGGTGEEVYVELETGDYTLPGQVCKDFVLTQRAGKINIQGSCDPSQGGVKDTGKALDMVKQMVKMTEVNFNSSSACQTINTALSYLKIPFPGDKKGGGIRVKRLLTYDKGLDGQPVLYGNEYIYKMYDSNLGKWRSSGVASNEPASIREENALVGYMARKKQSWASKVIAGEDKKQAEGPLGESILPGASVGYARVLVKNIHNGATSTGFTVKEYYTTKEHPVKMIPSDLNKKTSLIPLNTGLVNITSSNIWASQGYVFLLNNMNGQVKRVATYAGKYNIQEGLKNQVKISEQIYTYFNTGELVPVQSEQGGGIEYQSLGKETDVTLASKSVRDSYINANVEFDVTVSPMIILPIFFASFFPSLTKNDSGLYTYATSKVVRYPAIVKSVYTYQDGVEQSVEHLAFDKFSGQPVLTKAEDNVKGNNVSREAMAAWMYPGLGGKWMSEDKIIRLNSYGSLPGLVFASEGGKTFIRFSSQPSPGCIRLLDEFSAGDLVLLNGLYVGHVDSPDLAENRIPIYPAANMVNNLSSLGNGASISSIRILRSGNRNQLNVKAGATSYHYATLPNLYTSTAKYATAAAGTFEGDLSSALATSSTTFELAGGTAGYDQVNLAYFGNKIPACEAGNSQRIFNVRFRKKVAATGSVTLELLSFRFKCGNNALVLVE